MKIIDYTDELKTQVINFIQQTWLELGKTWDPTGIDKDLFEIPKSYQNSGGEFWVVMDQTNNVIGTAALKLLNTEQAELKRFYLHPAYRGRGIGEKMLEFAIEKAKENGFKAIKLDTSKRLVQACNLFRKKGFTEIDPYFNTDLSDTFMELKLEN